MLAIRDCKDLAWALTRDTTVNVKTKNLTFTALGEAEAEYEEESIEIFEAEEETLVE